MPFSVPFWSLWALTTVHWCWPYSHCVNEGWQSHPSGCSSCPDMTMWSGFIPLSETLDFCLMIKDEIFTYPCNPITHGLEKEVHFLDSSCSHPMMPGERWSRRENCRNWTQTSNWTAPASPAFHSLFYEPINFFHDWSLVVVPFCCLQLKASYQVQNLVLRVIMFLT